MSGKQIVILCCTLIVGLAACVGAFILGRAMIGEDVDPMAVAVAKASAEAYETIEETEMKVQETIPETEPETEEIRETHIDPYNPDEVYWTEPVDLTRVVVADSLAVRENSIADATPIGTLYYGDEIHVTGLVLCNGEEIGWARVDFNGQVGYVWTEWLAEP